MPDYEDHRYSIESTKRSHRAVCTCGWKSEWSMTSGLAGARWDAHLADSLGVEVLDTAPEVR